jgi:hypothetical protein
VSPEQQATVAATAWEIAGHLDAARDHLTEAYFALGEVVGHPDGADVAATLEGLGHSEQEYAQLLLLAGDVRAHGDALIAEMPRTGE